jgi:hypothetical protein
VARWSRAARREPGFDVFADEPAVPPDRYRRERVALPAGVLVDRGARDGEQRGDVVGVEQRLREVNSDRLHDPMSDKTRLWVVSKGLRTTPLSRVKGIVR